MLAHQKQAPEPPKRVVVLGAGGFVGGTIASKCRERGLNVLPLTRSEIDLMSPNASSSLAKLLRPDDAFIAAAAVAPVKSVAMLAKNIILLQAIVEALAVSPVSYLLNIGSDAVFADEPPPISEMSPRAPTSLHGIMHLAREVAFATLATPQATLRPTLIYGAADPHNGYGPNQFRRLIEAGNDIVLFGNGEERRDHVCVGDVAELAARMILHRSTGSLNAATGKVYSFREVAEMAVAASGSKVSISSRPRSGGMPHGGYRPFDPADTFAAFPDFSYTELSDELNRLMHRPIF